MTTRKPVTMILSNRDYILRTTLGHSIEFKKGEPVNVPPSIVSQAMAIGAAPVDGENPIPPEAPQEVVPVDPIDRQVQIREVVEQMFLDNMRTDFTATGNPKVAIVSDKVGYKIDSRELKTVLNKINQEREDEHQG